MSDVYLWRMAPPGVRVDRTVEFTPAGTHTDVMIDLDVEGNVIGIEVLDVDTVQVDGREVGT